MSDIIDGGVDDTPLEARDRVVVKLVMFGIEWVWTRPKAARWYLAVMRNEGNRGLDLIEELESGLPAETVKMVEARLRDPDDPLDTPHLMEVLGKLRTLALQGAGERPTVPSSDSSQSPTDDGEN